MSDSSCSEEDGKFLKVRSLQKFPPEVSDCLERLYANGMTGWGMDYSNDVELAVKSTGLSLSQVKVMAVKVLDFHYLLVTIFKIYPIPEFQTGFLVEGGGGGSPTSCTEVL